MSEQRPIARKIEKYLDNGKTSKPISKVIAHVYQDIIDMRELGFSWAQILSIINNNQCSFKVESKTLDVIITRIRRKGVNAKEGTTKKTENKHNKATGNVFSKIEEKGKIQHDNNPDLDKLLKEIKELKND